MIPSLRLEVSIDDQTLKLIDGGQCIREFAISTATKGMGFKMDSYRTPTGRFVISEKIGGGETRFQPVFAGNVAAAIADAVDGKTRAGTTYELGGPEVKTFKELMEFVLKTIERKRILVSLPFFAARMQATFLQFAPPPLTLTPDQVEMLRADNVVSDAAMQESRTLQGLGIEPETVEAIVPSYLWRFRRTGQFKSRTA